LGTGDGPRSKTGAVKCTPILESWYKFALDTGLAVTPGSPMERKVGRNREDVDIPLTSARIHVGLSVYPFR
jgi:hypothetical protein